MMSNSNIPQSADVIPARRQRRTFGRRWFFAPALAVCLLLALLLTDPSRAASWEGREEVRDGVVHVLNPAEAMNGTVTIDLKELWRLGGETDDEDEFFGLISRITTDEGGNVYLLDTQLSEIKVFSPGGEYLRTVGREGEGPGEFRQPTGMFFVPGGNLGVLQAAPPKIVLLTKEGEPAGEFPTPQLAGEGFMVLMGAQYLGDRLAVAAQASNFDQEKGTFTQNLFIAAVDAEGNETARFHDESRLWEFANPIIEEKTWDTIQNRWSTSKDGRVFGCIHFDGYRVHCWNSDGSVDRIIEREHQTHKRNAEEMDQIRSIYSAFTARAPNSELKMSDHDKDITSIHPRDDGTLWVLSSPGARGAGEGIVGTFDILDRQGRFVQQVTLKGEGTPRRDGYYFVGDRLYVVTELLQAAMAMQGGGGGEGLDEGEEPEPMAVIAYEIDESKLSLN